MEEGSRTVLDYGFYNSNNNNGADIIQQFIHSFTRFGISDQDEIQGTRPPTTMMMMMAGEENSASISSSSSSSEFILSPNENINGGFIVANNFMGQQLNRRPAVHHSYYEEDIQVLDDQGLNNGFIIPNENRNPPIIMKEYSLFENPKPDHDHCPTCNGVINIGRNFNPVVGGSRGVWNGNYGSLTTTTTDGGTPNLRYFPVQEENNILNMARTESGSEELVYLIERGTPMEIQMMLEHILGCSMFEWMIDRYAHCVFVMLVDKCQNHQLQFIVNKATAEPDKFADIAYSSEGSKSIQKIIRSIKKITSMEISITKALRPRSYELLTHKVPAEVVKLCFQTFGEEPMKLFLETLSGRLLDLATDGVGCFSIYTLIDSIKGCYRNTVLNYFAINALFLANDPCGNFIVQHLLKLNNVMVTEIIIRRLSGNIEDLAQKQGGSHVVETMCCSSPKGLSVVISEITNKGGNTLYRIAQHPFGNYVISKALVTSKNLTDKRLYMKLLDALRPYYLSLNGKSMGRHVAKVIKDDI